MNKQRFFLLSGAALAVLLLTVALGVTAVFAQDTTPPTDEDTSTTDRPMPLGRHGGQMGGFDMLGMGSGDWTMFDTAAEALGLTPVELFTELHDGNTLEEIASAQGVDITNVQEAMNVARSAAMRQRIEQAVADGTMTQAQADWMLEGMEQGYMPGGRGMRGGGLEHPAPPTTE